MLQSVIFIDRNWMQWYTGTSPTILSANFPPKAVVDLEVMDREAMRNFIKAFIAQYHIVPLSVIIVLSSSIYLYEDIPSDKDKEERISEEFLSSVPFENFTSKEYPLEKGKRIVAVSKSLYEIIRQTLESAGFVIAAIIPEFILDQHAAKRWLDAEMGKAIVRSVDSLKLKTILTQEEVNEEEVQKRQIFMTKNKRAMILGIVFALLILILIVLIIKMGI